jgi:hypothetical protein
MRHLKVYEEFDLDKFLEDPSGNIHDDNDPEIGPGDWVTSYRGIGQVLEMPNENNGLIRVQLIDSSKSKVLIPLEKATKIKKEEADIAVDRIPETAKELGEISDEMEKYSESIDAYDSDSRINNPESAIEYLEDILIKLIELKSKDPYTVYHKEYSNIILLFGNLVHIITESTDDQDLIKRLNKIDDDFYELSE